MVVSLFDTMVGVEGLEEMIASYPQELKAFFGDVITISRPKGYLDVCYFSYITIIVGIYVIRAGASLLVSDEEKAILDLVMAWRLAARIPGSCPGGLVALSTAGYARRRGMGLESALAVATVAARIAG